MIRDQSAQFNHLNRQLPDFDSIPHFQKKNLSSLSHGSRLNHQPDGFSNTHEVTGDFRMGHCDRSSFLDLFPKLWYNRTTAVENIPESHHTPFG